MSDEEVAQAACYMEIDVLQNPIGKQDQYAAAYGGFNYYQFNKDGSVFVEPVLMSKESFKKLEENLIMLYVGGEHNASKILEQQSKNISSGEKEASQLRICELTKKLKYELENNNVDIVGEILHENWMIKNISKGISNPKFDEWYELALKKQLRKILELVEAVSSYFMFRRKSKILKAMHELPEMNLN